MCVCVCIGVNVGCEWVHRRRVSWYGRASYVLEYPQFLQMRISNFFYEKTLLRAILPVRLEWRTFTIRKIPFIQWEMLPGAYSILASSQHRRIYVKGR